MTIRITHVELTDSSTVPAEAEVHLSVWTDAVEPGLEVRGRLTGPHCRFASTVEVAYPFRRAASTSAFTLRAVIPEASLWDPESPHLYLGPVELWHDGIRIDVRQVRHGLRTFVLGPRGLRINGRLTPLVGREVAGLSEDEAQALREAGVNLVVVPADAAEDVWDFADRVGLVVIAREKVPERGHPSSLGWVGEGGFEVRGGELFAAGVRCGTVTSAADAP